MKTILDGGDDPILDGSSLSKVIDLEISGERDGNGYWSGACAPLEMIEDLYSLCVEYWELPATDNGDLSKTGQSRSEDE
jgi:hypothetical protein